MLVSIVIPSFQQCRYLEETLCSILSQDGPQIEVFVIDGGSTDGTVELLQNCRDGRVAWVSEADHGQADAINKGLARIRGDVWAYVNADDPLLPGCLEIVSRAFDESEVFWVGGIGEVFDEDGVRGEIRCEYVTSPKDWLAPWSRTPRYVVPFSGCNFMRREVIEAIGMFDPSYHYSMDIEYCVRAALLAGYTPLLIDSCLARWRWHPDSKTMKRGIAYGFREDEIRIAERYADRLDFDDQLELRAELKYQRRVLASRKAMCFLSEGNVCDARQILNKSLREDPQAIFSRPWIGAYRRVLLHSLRQD